MTDLLPCPFCGGSNLVRSVDGGILPDFIEKEWFDYRKKPYYITCTLTCDDCGTMLQGYTATSKHDDCNPADAIEDAYSKWNTRAERTCRFINDSDGEFPPKCSACGYEPSIYECAWLADNGYKYDGNYCPNCGARVVSE